MDGTFVGTEKTGSTEYLKDSSNFTGYAQTIAETTKKTDGAIDGVTHLLTVPAIEFVQPR